MPRTTAQQVAASLAAAALLALGACTDRNPAASVRPGLPASAPRMLTCTVAVRAATMSCGGEGTDVGSASAVIIGGQDVHVRLTSTGVGYDAFNRFRMDVTLENLTAQVMGPGVIVFFSSGPVVVEGSGLVSVENPDGEDFFTGPQQPYFDYPGWIAPGDTAGPREWRFNVPETVERFRFGVYVDAYVQFQKGWVTAAPLSVGLPLGDSVRLSATVYDVTGAVRPADPVAWQDPYHEDVVEVDAQGLVRTRHLGSTAVQAVSGVRWGGWSKIKVYAPGNPITTIESVHVQPSVWANGRDSLWVRARYSGPLPTSRMQVTLTHAPAPDRVCSSTTPVSTEVGMEFRCAFVFEDGALGGQWQVSRVEVGSNSVDGSGLIFGGVSSYVFVKSPHQDLGIPSLDSVSLSPRTVTAGQQPLRIRVGASDTRSGVDRVDLWVRSAGNPQLAWTGTRVSTTGASSVFEFEQVIPTYLHEGRFVIDSLRVRDANGNQVTATTGSLAARDFPNQFTVTGTSPDTVPPVLTAFSLATPVVVADQTDPVSFTFTGSEPAGESGVRWISMAIGRSGTYSSWPCGVYETIGLPARTVTCKWVFRAADVGTWEVRSVELIDVMDNQRMLSTAKLQAAGFPTTFTVRAP
jgi:hypothetical protein